MLGKIPQAIPRTDRSGGIQPSGYDACVPAVGYIARRCNMGKTNLEKRLRMRPAGVLVCG